MRKRQTGITLTGFILVGIGLVLVSILGFKLVPAYLEQYTINKIFRQIAHNPEFTNATAADVRAAYAKQILIETVRAAGPSDLDITRESGQLVIETQYQVTIPLIFNISLLVDFRASSR